MFDLYSGLILHFDFGTIFIASFRYNNHNLKQGGSIHGT